MPRTRYGQLITFSIEKDADQTYANYIWVNVKKNDTVLSIAARRGNPEDARAIADLNGVRSVRSVLGRSRIRVPGTLRQSDVFHVLAGDGAPTVVGGYAKFSTVDRPQRVGISTFDGYDPLQVSVPIQFENFIEGEGVDIERDIALLERMAGRGQFAGAASGPPPIIQVLTTNGSGLSVPLVPANLQRSRENPTGPQWWVAGIDWDPNPIRNTSGNRIRQKATVSLMQYVRANLLSRSAAARSKSNK